MADEPLVVAEVADGVGIARLNRPEARNALSPELMGELAELLEAWDADPAIGCIVIAGSEDWFAPAPTSRPCATARSRRRSSPRPPRSGPGWPPSARR